MLTKNAGFKLPPTLWIPIAWIAFAVADAGKTVASMHAQGMHHYWTRLFTIEALSWLPWVFGSLLIVRLSVRLRGRPRAIEWGAHIIAAIVIGMCFTVWSDLLIVRFQPFAPEFKHWTPWWPSDFFNNLLDTAVLYSCVFLSYKLIESRASVAKHETEVAQLSEQLARSHLNALRSQIEPHFLFNSLNAVAGLVREERSDAAVEMIVQLSDFLRRTLSESHRQEVALSDEMEFVRRYLTIQQARFADRLTLDIQIQDGLQNAAVPNLILQPLVENAVKHGISRRRDGGSVRVAASSAGSALDLYVANDGPDLPDDWHLREASIGIKNVCNRLRTLYGDASHFDIRNRIGGGVEVLLRIPLHAIGSAE